MIHRSRHPSSGLVTQGRKCQSQQPVTKREARNSDYLKTIIIISSSSTSRRNRRHHHRYHCRRAAAEVAVTTTIFMVFIIIIISRSSSRYIIIDIIITMSVIMFIFIIISSSSIIIRVVHCPSPYCLFCLHDWSYHRSKPCDAHVLPALKACTTQEEETKNIDTTSCFEALGRRHFGVCEGIGRIGFRDKRVSSMAWRI